MNESYLGTQLISSVSSNIGYCTSDNTAINGIYFVEDSAVVSSAVLPQGNIVYAQSSTTDIQLKASHELKPLKFLPL
jgi:hypothetical protein